MIHERRVPFLPLRLRRPKPVSLESHSIWSSFSTLVLAIMWSTPILGKRRGRFQRHSLSPDIGSASSGLDAFPACSRTWEGDNGGGGGVTTFFVMMGSGVRIPLAAPA